LKRESANTSKEAVASKLLRKRLGEIALGKPVGPDVERTTFEELAAMVVSDYKANARKSLARVQDALAHLREYFGDFRAVEILANWCPNRPLKSPTRLRRRYTKPKAGSCKRISVSTIWL
jgi:hypothetical protein